MPLRSRPPPGLPPSIDNGSRVTDLINYHRFGPDHLPTHYFKSLSREQTLRTYISASSISRHDRQGHDSAVHSLQRCLRVEHGISSVIPRPQSPYGLPGPGRIEAWMIGDGPSWEWTGSEFHVQRWDYGMSWLRGGAQYLFLLL
jgi:hypothetical protein